MVERITACLMGGLIAVIFETVASVAVDKFYQHTILSWPCVMVAVAFAVMGGCASEFTRSGGLPGLTR